MTSLSRTRPSDQHASVQPAEEIIDDVDTSSSDSDSEDIPALEPAPEYDDDDSEDDAGNPDEDRGVTQSFESACAENPIISRLRKIVMAIRASGQRRNAFTTWIENGNRNKTFVLQNGSVIIEPMQLLPDVRTRWDSTYEMIRRCIEMRLVSPGLYLDDYTLYHLLSLGHRNLPGTTRK
jgi:hypothetical protein